MRRFRTGAIPILITADINLEEDASGWAGILGVNFAPNDKLNTALTYISKTKNDYDMEVKRDTVLPDGTPLSSTIGFPDGSKRRIDIPALLGFGISYKFLPQLKVDLNYTYYFEKDADIDTFEGEGDSWDLGLSGEYVLAPVESQSRLSSHRYRPGRRSADIRARRTELSANTIAAGAVWSPTPPIAIRVLNERR